MRRQAWFVLLLILPPVGAQEPGLAPVQTVIDAVPEIVSTALSEARRDGTADDAQATSEDLARFALGLRGTFEVPAGSAAAEARLEDALPWAVQLAQLTTVLPEDIGAVERNVAACLSWGPSKGSAEATRWIADGSTAATRIATYEAAYRQLRDQAPAGLELAPLDAAIQQLASFQAGRVEGGTACYQEVALQLNITLPEPEPFLRIVPDESWPGSRVVAIGRIGLGNVSLSAPGLVDLRIEATPSFVAPIAVPASARLGAHDVVATLNGERANATLVLHAAPSRMDIDAPARVLVGERFLVEVRVHSDLPPGRVPIDWDDRQTTLIDGLTTRTFRIDEPGPFVIEVHYPGTARVAPAEASRTVLVEVAAPADTVGAQEGGDFFGQDGGGALFGVDRWILWTVAAVVLLVVASLAVARRTRTRPMEMPAETVEFEETHDEGFFGAVAAFMRQLVGMGGATPGTTLREAARDRPDLQRIVPTFEKARYAKVGVPPGTGRHAQGFFRRLVAKLRGGA